MKIFLNFGINFYFCKDYIISPIEKEKSATPIKQISIKLKTMRFSIALETFFCHKGLATF